MGRPWTHLHTHSEWSNFDGFGKQADFVRAAKEQGATAIALTEHGTIRGCTRLHDEAEEIGIRPIYGVEFYLCDDMERKGLTPEEKAEALEGVKGISERKDALYQAEVRAGVRERFHLTILAKNPTGLRNLFRLSSLGWIRGYYKRPRIDMRVLAEHHEGLVVMSGCSAGAIAADALRGDFDAAIGRAMRLQALFGEDFYAEIMPHSYSPGFRQSEANQAVIKIAKSLGIKVVATQDAHYVGPDDWVYQEAMLCIHTRDVMANPRRFKFDTHDFWLKDRAEMEESFRQHHGYLSEAAVKAALDLTQEIADKAQAKLDVDRFKALVPPIEVPEEYGDEYKYLCALCYDGWETRGLDGIVAVQARRRGVPESVMRRNYLTRLSTELAAIRRQKCVRYFLVVHDLYQWVHKIGIMAGPGRGSVGGSLVAFLMRITDIDPLQHGLIFERFLNPARIDMPDIDADFEDVRREEIIQFLRDRYGEDHVAQIAANGHLTGKACLRDIARIMGIPISEIEPVTSSIITRSSGDERASATIEDSFKEFPVCQAFDKKYPQVLQFAKKLEGQAKTLGKHAAGVVVSPEPLIDMIPLEYRNNTVVTAVDMYGVSNLGLMKLDVLGIRNLTMMRMCLQAIEKRHGVKIDLNELPLDDRKTLKGFTDHNYTGIFQYDTPSADKITEGVEFTSFDDVVAMIALDRPGTARSGLATEYLKRKKNPKAIKSIHPIVDEICKDTLGVIVYQEHVLRIFTDVAGFSPATADSLRRKIAKKFGDEAIAKERANFVTGAMERGFSQKLAEQLISQIQFFGSYGFNRSHSVAYGMTSYRQMWLKTYYPLEFMWALLSVEPNPKQITRLVKESFKMGIEVHNPDVTSSGTSWTIDGDAIVGSLSDLKGVGPKAVEAILAARPYKTFVDFCEKVDRRRCHRGVVAVLLKGGAMDSLVPNPKWLFEHLDDIWGEVGKEGWKPKMAGDLVKSLEEPQWGEDEAQHLAAEVNPMAFGADPLEPFSNWLTPLGFSPIPLDLDDLYDRKAGFIWGQIIEVRYNQVGDFHTGPDPSPEEKRRMGWGRRYANINIEDHTGRHVRAKVDIAQFEAFREIIDKGVGAIVAAHVGFNSRWKSTKVHYLVNLQQLRDRVGDVDMTKTVGVEGNELQLTPFELSLFPDFHPVVRYTRKDLNKMLAGKKSGVHAVTAMVTHVTRHIDKRGGEMAWIGLSGVSSYVEVLCFASSWPTFEGLLEPGLVARFTLKIDKATILLDDRVGGVEPLA